MKKRMRMGTRTSGSEEEGEQRVVRHRRSEEESLRVSDVHPR